MIVPDGTPVPVTGSPSKGVLALPPRTLMTAAFRLLTISDPFVRVPVAMSVSAVLFGIGSCDGLSDDSAVIWVASATFACTLESRNALVGLERTLTLTAAPAPVFPARASVNAIFWNVSSLAACTASPPNDLMVVPTPIDALVVIVRTLIPAEPATAVCDPTATPRPCVEKSLTCGVLSTGAGMSAVTLTPSALILSEEPMVAVFVTLAMLSDTAAPIEVWLMTARPSARARALDWLVVPTVSAPVFDVTVRPFSISAIVLVLSTLTATAAAMPVFVWPLLPPELLAAELEGEVIWLFEVEGAGTLGELEPPALWASEDWLCDCWSAVLSLLPAPCSLATEVAWLDEVATSVTLTGPPAVTLRSRSARTESCVVLTTTEAPRPTDSLAFTAESASEFTEKAPVAAIVRPAEASIFLVSEPILAVVWSLAIATATPPAVAMPPSAPFCPQVVMV